jgi:hypothetical protein
MQRELKFGTHQHRVCGNSDFALRAVGLKFHFMDSHHLGVGIPTRSDHPGSHVLLSQWAAGFKSLGTVVLGFKSVTCEIGTTA